MRESTLGMGSPEAGQGWEKEERDEVTLGMESTEKGHHVSVSRFYHEGVSLTDNKGGFYLPDRPGTPSGELNIPTLPKTCPQSHQHLRHITSVITSF